MKERNLYIIGGIVLAMLLYIVSARRSVCEDFTDDPALIKEISDRKAAINQLQNQSYPDEATAVPGRKAVAALVEQLEPQLNALIKQRDDARVAGAAAEAKASTLATSAVPISTTSTETPNTYSGSPMSSIDISKLMSAATDFTRPSTTTTPPPKPQEDTLSSVTSVLGSGLSLGALIGIIVAVMAVGIIALVSVMNITGLSSFFPKDSLPLSPIPPPPGY